jgi:hypothetical protein
MQVLLTRLTPGDRSPVDWRCPSCDGQLTRWLFALDLNLWRIHDSLRSAWPYWTVPRRKGGPPGCLLRSELNGFECGKCGGQGCLLGLDVIANPEVSKAWIERYFRHDIVENDSQAFVVTLRRPGNVRRNWLLARMETPEGTFDRHFIKMALTPETRLWKEPSALLAEALPVALALRELPRSGKPVRVIRAA